MRVREGRRVREDRNSAVWWATPGRLWRCELFGEPQIVLGNRDASALENRAVDMPQRMIVARELEMNELNARTSIPRRT